MLSNPASPLLPSLTGLPPSLSAFMASPLYDAALQAAASASPGAATAAHLWAAQTQRQSQLTPVGESISSADPVQTSSGVDEVGLLQQAKTAQSPVSSSSSSVAAVAAAAAAAAALSHSPSPTTAMAAAAFQSELLRAASKCWAKVVIIIRLSDLKNRFYSVSVGILCLLSGCTILSNTAITSVDLPSGFVLLISWRYSGTIFEPELHLFFFPLHASFHSMEECQ